MPRRLTYLRQRLRLSNAFQNEALHFTVLGRSWSRFDSVVGILTDTDEAKTLRRPQRTHAVRRSE